MKKYGLILLSIVLTLTLAACQTGDGDDNGDNGEEDLRSVTYPLEAVDGSGVTGTVQLEETSDEETTVTISVSGEAVVGNHPAHIHEGDVGSSGEIVYPLTNVDDSGGSVTVVEAGYDAILDADNYVNVHLSPDDLATVVATGEIGDDGTEVEDDGEDGDDGEDEDGGEDED